MNRQRTFKDKWMQSAYEYYRIATDIPINSRTLLSTAYWNGRDNVGAMCSHCMPVRNTISYAIYMAGRDRQVEIDTEE